MQEFINSLREESIVKPILVEGKKDKIALEKIGIQNIHALSSQPLFEFVEKASKHKHVIVLFDNDRQGKKITKLFLQAASRNGLKVDKRFMIMSRNLRISHIEGIRGCGYGKNSSCFIQVHNSLENQDKRSG